MHILDALETPHEVDLLVAFSDISGFHRAVHKRNPQQFFDLLSGYYELFGDIIEGAGGKVIKFIGDSVLFVFAADQVDIGVLTIKDLQGAGAACARQRNVLRALLQSPFRTGDGWPDRHTQR